MALCRLLPVFLITSGFFADGGGIRALQTDQADQADRGGVRSSGGGGSAVRYGAAAGAGYLIGSAAAQSNNYHGTDYRENRIHETNSTGYYRNEQRHVFIFPPLLLVGLIYLCIRRRQQHRLEQQNSPANEVYVATPVPANGQQYVGGVPVAVPVTSI
jgi:hypothetical protein